MKINLSARSVVLIGMMSLAPLYGAQPEFDTYFKSPTQVALAPLRDCFTQADNTLKRSPDIKHREEIFYSQAMSLYITKIYNNRDYARRLSQDGKHISDFLVICNEFGFNCEQVYTGLRLFYNKFKETTLIDDTVVGHVLKILPTQLEAYFPLRATTTSKPQRSSAKLVENILLSQFTEHLTEPKVSNEKFFEQVSRSISSEIVNSTSGETEGKRERLRQVTIRLVEHMVGKVAWYPQNHEGIWRSPDYLDRDGEKKNDETGFINMAHNVYQICGNGIMNHRDDLDDVINSLVTRFCGFIEEHGGLLPVSFYQQAEADIIGHKVAILEEEELDAGVKPKKERLLEALSLGKTKAIACQKHGLIPAEANLKR